MDYFYVQPDQILGNAIIITGEESKHLARVLRKTIGDSVFITDGNDMMYEALIGEIGKSDTRCLIKAIHHKYHESTVDVTLAVSLLKNPARFDFLIEKATELGVRQIVPLQCEHTIPSHIKQERIEKLAVAALKQCGRSWLPRIAPRTKFIDLLNNSNQDVKFMPHEQSNPAETISTILQHYPGYKSILLVVGPEGGFSDDETEQAMKAGYHVVSLGVRRLRAETAALVAVSQSIKV